MTRPAWVDKVFEFTLKPEQLPEVVSKLNATTGRLRKLLGTVSEADMEIRIDNKWSIKENIGHLTDLEELHLGRLDDLKAKKDVLRPADMSNAVTEASDHHSSSLRELLIQLNEARSTFITAIQGLDNETHAHVGLHERLGVKMRPIDVAAFVSAHDEHHIQTIKDILEGLVDED